MSYITVSNKNGILVTLILFLAGIGVTYHGPVLTWIGFAGGFRIISKFGLLLSIVGAILTLGIVIDPDLKFRSVTVLTIVIAGAAVVSLIFLPNEPILTKVELGLVYYSSVLTIPVAAAKSEGRSALSKSLILLYVGAIVLAYVAALSRNPQGPIFFYLLISTVISIAMATLFYLIGNFVPRNGIRSGN